MDFDISTALQSLHDGNEMVFVMDVEFIGVNELTNLRTSFERAYRTMFNEDVVIKMMKRNNDTQGLLVMVLEKSNEVV